MFVPGATTVRSVEFEESPLYVAEIVVFGDVPTEAEAVTRPPAVIVAAAGTMELHFTLPVRSPAVPFEYVPVALNCSVSPAVRLTG
jgi:hypothetical protein